MASIAFLPAVLIALAARADEPKEKETADIRELKLREWAPKSMMVTESHEPAKPRFPAVDVHNHLGSGKATLTPERVAGYLTEMNEAGVRTVVNLDGGWGDRLKETLAALDEAHPDRFITFAQVDFAGIDDDGWSDREAKQLEESFKAGGKGLKLHKSLGLGVRYKDGRLMPVDDPKLDAVWRMCAKYHRPVMIHTADPAAFFTPLDRFNERWHELNEHPQWLFYGDKFPAREDLIAQYLRVVGRHPRTTFIGAHFGNNAEDMAAVGNALDANPNLFVDIDARISELGRQPYTARKFFIKYQDRILFGTDTTPRRDAFRIYYRFLETDDEYFDCAASHHLQGFWRIYGIFLPDEVLEKIYSKNADRIFAAAAKTPVGDGEEKSAAASRDGVVIAKNTAAGERPKPPSLKVPRTADFAVTGDGADKAWEKAEWTALRRRGHVAGADYKTRFKILYSDKGIYVLFDGEDARLSATIKEDFLDLWKEDVFEFFFWPDERQTVYFEYEISPLGVELPILIPNFEDRFLGWRPWHYEGDRKVKKLTSVSGGAKESGAAIKGWRAEVFVPFELLKPLGNVPPKSGARWRANFYRMDYDEKQPWAWDWAPVGPSFHEYQKFGTLEFE
ncbi:MAG TPA: carbohydrate-binding family 9-like protein [Pirellulales bacterium]